jgi:hypothetical protein
MDTEPREDALMAADLITMDEAARLAGYASNAGNLRRAAGQNKLKTVKKGWQRFTTRAWLDEYLATLRHPNTGIRGRPRTQRTPSKDSAHGTPAS